MDVLWERSVPIYKMSIGSMLNIFRKFDNGIKINGYKLINVGARNSNYIVDTSLGKFFLRICPEGSEGYRNELVSYLLLKERINIPRPLYVDNIGFTKYVIYEYINGVSLQGVSLTEGMITKIAEALGRIHNLKEEEYSKYKIFKFPPFKLWYDLFLDNENLKMRLDDDIICRVKKLVSEKSNELEVIDSYKGYTHCDFRPSNMIIDKLGDIYYVDWEFSNYNHILGDIGQFFREFNGRAISSSILELFEEKYNGVSEVKLPKGWFDLAKLRDLVNPLQMLGDDANAPRKYEDLKKIVIETLEYFGY